jgi:hypothetical protein
LAFGKHICREGVFQKSYFKPLLQKQKKPKLIGWRFFYGFCEESDTSQLLVFAFSFSFND